MNRTKIEWTDYSWNPITGCLHGCWYCYAKKLTVRFPDNFPHGFEPWFYPERLNEPFKLTKPSKIFCCSISDLFAPWTKLIWREKVLKVIEKCAKEKPYLIFQLLTKQPEHATYCYLPKNVWLGVTVTEQDELEKIEILKKCNAEIKFVSFEPLLEEIDTEKAGEEYSLDGVDWIIIGKLTGSRKIKLHEYWVEKLIEQAENQDIPIFMKNNLKSHFGDLIQNYPNNFTVKDIKDDE